MSGPSISTKINRRFFLKTAVAGAVGAGAGYYLWSTKSGNGKVKYTIKRLDNSARGHIVREAINTQNIFKKESLGTLIVGSGISGLVTGYSLQKKSYTDFKILEADSRVGGNSAFDQNDVSHFPLGAHYLPVIRNDDQKLQDFLKTIGVIKSFEKGLPVYNEEYLCHMPHERLFIKGQWQESLIPTYAANQTQIEEIKSFLVFVDALRDKKGRDGRYLFSIPVNESSQDAEWIKLDQISFREFLDSKGWKGAYLSWYVNYCCRDDFGLDANETSAWAGLHYFASRNGKAANAEVQSVLTWPHGNGFFVEQLQKEIESKISTHSTVRKVIKHADHYEVFYSDADLNTCVIDCKNLVYAIPKAVIKYIQPELDFGFKIQSYPWIVSNIKVKKAALEVKSSLSWDNVRFGTASLGYVNACHQLLSQDSEYVNITFYHAFSSGDSLELRRKLSKMSDAELMQIMLEDLNKMHPHIEEHIQEVQIKIWGHGMVAPKPDYIWNHRKKTIKQEPEGIIFAHTERAGISIFEEGFHQGLSAAEKILKRNRA